MSGITVVYPAAHGGFAREPVPLGGGAAIANLLEAEWLRTRPFELRMVTPHQVFAGAGPSGRKLVQFSEMQYARFCHEFRAAATREVLRYDPRVTKVLINDISEAPDFRRLAEAGFELHTIYHVDVVAYVAAMYGRSLIRPETLTALWEKLRVLPWPRILRLVFENQRDSLLYSRSVIVPSAAMKTLLRRMYPSVDADKIHVLPWGSPYVPCEIRIEDRAAARERFGIASDAMVLLAMSRISPEKGQDLLLEALALWEQAPDYPQRPVHLLLCGEPAFMRGERFARRLRTLAARLRRVQVHWPGYVSGSLKEAVYAAADVYVFPSRHESYGLTLMESLAHGLPAIALDHYGAQEIMREDFGWLVTGLDGLTRALGRCAASTTDLQTMGRAALQYAGERPFGQTAARLAKLLLSRSEQ